MPRLKNATSASAVRLSEIAERLGIGEWATRRIVRDLVEGGHVVRTHVGRRNTRAVDSTRSFRHPLEADHATGDVFRLLARRN
jgi:DNA-binding Lrp family transcriptional regulator